MDVNITSPIIADIALTQSLWIPILNFLVGLVGAAVGAVSVYYVARYQRSQEMKKVHREERKQAYIKLLSLLKTILWEYKISGDDKSKASPFSAKEILSTITEFKLLGSPELNYLFLKDNGEKDFFAETSIQAFLDDAIPAMAKELQNEDIYAIVKQKMDADVIKR